MDQLQPLKVLYLAAEAVPFAKVGGLADVAGSLPKAIRALGHDVRLMLPRYRRISGETFDLVKVGDPFPVPVGPEEELVHLMQTDLGQERLPVYLIWNDLYFSSRDRDRVYGFEDDAQRFAVFSHAALAALEQLDWQPDLIHANDWHTALVPTWLNTDGRRFPFYRQIASLFTIHNLAYQGIAGRLILSFARMDYIKHLQVERPGTVNWMAQAIAHTDLINTVSPRYAREILTPEMGMGLDSLLRERVDRLYGVLNGIDCEVWDPAVDSRISHHYDVSSLERRSANKTILQQQARLPVADVPIIAMVSRLDEVKGLDLMGPVLDWLMTQDIQFVLLGTGQDEYEEMFASYQRRFPDRLRAFLKFDETLARRIYAGADVFLMPSKIEPCGLGQLIAMHYGAIPVVRATGGLADTVEDHDELPGHGTGFTFSNYTPDACQAALARALVTFSDRSTWRGLQRRAMTRDFSWAASAREYVKLYYRALNVHKS